MKVKATVLLALVFLANGCGPEPCSVEGPADPWYTIRCDLKCADDKGNDATYEARWRPASDGNKDKLLIFFEGGGACWNYQTCANIEKLEIPDGGGIFDATDSRNPFQLYNLVVIPYCTWDLHWGSVTVEYLHPTPTPTSTPESITIHDHGSRTVAYLNPTPTSTPESITIHHHGFQNADAVLRWVYKEFEDPTSVVIVGISAGSLGSILHTPYIMDHYDNGKTAILHIGDSGVIFPPDCDLKDYRALRRFEGAPLAVPYVTAGDRLDLAEFYGAVANSYPQHKFALFNFAHDCVQNGLYARYSDPTMPLWKIIRESETLERIKAAVGSIHNLVDAEAGNFYSYTESSASCVPIGTPRCEICDCDRPDNRCHCILGDDKWFYQLTVNEVLLSDWVSALEDLVSSTPGQSQPPSHRVEGECQWPWDTCP